MESRIPPNRYLTPKLAAAYLSMSVFSIYRLIARRAIPFIPLHPSSGTARRSSVRFDIEALDAWMKRQTVKSSGQYVDERTVND